MESAHPECLRIYDLRLGDAGWDMCSKRCPCGRDSVVCDPQVFLIVPKVNAVDWPTDVKLGRPACQRQRNLA